MVIHNTPLYYAIINSTDVNLLNFEELITSLEGIRYSLDGTKALVKWKEIEIPQSIQNSNFEGPYDQNQILQIVSSLEWENLN